VTLSIVVASRNAGKIREIRLALASLAADIVVREDLPEVVEDGATFVENARKKAVAAARFSGQWALADDSGLEVDALGGAPGVHSARWSGAGTAGNNAKLLAEMEGVPAEARTARFRAVVAVAAPDGKVVAEAEGCCEGRIGFEPRGAGGFGYDPLFLVPDLGRTMAELTPGEKDALSHRGKALRELRGPLTRALSCII
jgi:XTP/dITP diphosphohydrolase